MNEEAPLTDVHRRCIPKSKVERWAAELDAIENAIQYGTESRLLRDIIMRMREALR